VDEAEKRRKIQALRDSFLLFAPKVLKIQDKGGNLVPFTMNKAQQYLHQRMEAQKAKTGKVRGLIGKGRQAGVTTYVGGRFYHRTSMNQGVQTFILTHEQEASDNLFDMVSRFHDNNPIKPTTGASNAKELVFDKLRSGYSVGTAGTKAVGRSSTNHRLHWSEVAYSPNAAGHGAGIVQTVPDLPGTEIIKESTGNGAQGEFYESWQMAEAGRGDYEAWFVPWFWSQDYVRDVPPDVILSEEETRYAQLYELSPGQMLWRRAKID
jgi:hypothetical protein